MGSRGTTTVNFGAFPGSCHATANITGESGILSNSMVEAWLLPVDTADHTADEHIVDPPMITAGNISAAVGFTIYATARDGLPVPDRQRMLSGTGPGGAIATVGSPAVGDAAPMPYGQWTVGWVWL